MTDKEILEAMQKMIQPIHDRLNTIDHRLDSMQEDIEQIKEDTAITRNQVNLVSNWAEEAQIEVKIPLYKKAE